MIDIRELRIGSHVEFNGKRSEILGINVSDDEYVPVIIDTSLASVEPDEIAPIPITAELLDELGFDATERDNEYEKRIGESLLRISVIHNDTWAAAVRERQYYIGTMFCCYLHEFEALVYMTTKQELIKED